MTQPWWEALRAQAEADPDDPQLAQLWMAEAYARETSTEEERAAALAAWRRCIDTPEKRRRAFLLLIGREDESG